MKRGRIRADVFKKTTCHHNGLYNQYFVKMGYQGMQTNITFNKKIGIIFATSKMN